MGCVRGENRQIKKIRLTGATALAAFLGVEAHSAVMARAEVLFAAGALVQGVLSHARDRGCALHAANSVRCEYAFPLDMPV